ncbi:MAG TPA: hypothetical protein VIV88_17640 [Gemmatimonadales bacterium]
MIEAANTRAHPAETAIALSALDCALNDQKATYASSELTTGKRAYLLMREHGVRESASLMTKLGEQAYHRQLLEVNVAAAKRFAARLRERLGSVLVITPAPFVAPRWGQKEYLAFWETLLRTRVANVFFNDDWQYSSGCAFEFAVAHDAGLPTWDAQGASLSLGAGISLIERAVAQMAADGIALNALPTNLARLRELHGAATKE